MTGAARAAVAWSPGELLQLVRQQAAVSRSAMARLTGLAPSTVATRLEGLLAAGYLVEDEEQSDRGRKPRELSLNANRGLIAAVDIGSRHTRIGFTDLTGRLLGAVEHDLARPRDAASYLDWLAGEIAGGAGRYAQPLAGVGLSIAAPIHRETKLLSHPMYLPGWDALDPAETVGRALGVPAVADNDATLMALAEHRLNLPLVKDMLFVKLGSAIGAGLVIGGELHSGRTGGAGEIGHMPVEAGRYSRACQCGRVNCLEACFGRAALIDHLVHAGLTADGADLRSLAAEGNREVGELLRDAGTQIGDAIGVICNLVNPEHVVVGGSLSQLDTLTQALRASLYARALPLIGSGLSVSISQNGADASILGAACRVLDLLLSEDAVNASLDTVLRAG